MTKDDCQETANHAARFDAGHLPDLQLKMVSLETV
jgi:hypothetical protein